MREFASGVVHDALKIAVTLHQGEFDPSAVQSTASWSQQHLFSSITLSYCLLQHVLTRSTFLAAWPQVYSIIQDLAMFAVPVHVLRSFIALCNLQRFVTSCVSEHWQFPACQAI